MTAETIAALLKPYGTENAPQTNWSRIYDQLAAYLDLILKWNLRMNLTAIKTPEEIVRRHFGESLFAGLQLDDCPTLLDFGSGAGFPGVPIQLLRPDVQVTLAESHGKKASFLYEVIRTLDLPTEVWAARVESMPLERQFHTVALRAVDNMGAAIDESARRASNRVALLTTRRPQLLAIPEPFRASEPIPLPESANGILLVAERI